MTEDQGYHSVVSLHLARTLDEVGLNWLTVRKRRNATLSREHIQTMRNRLNGLEVTLFHFGSQTEGATTPGLGSDLDTLICHDNVNVIEDLEDWQQDKTNLLMLHDDTAPGYCRLQLLRPDVRIGREDLPDDNFTYDSKKRVIMKNVWCHSSIQEDQAHRSGPAVSWIGEPGFMDADRVNALRFRRWPKQADRFIKRRRRYGWPSQHLLEEVTRDGVFLVPVGHKLSLTEPLEWRLSASLAERRLMFSLSIVHIKCYVVLKMLVKTYVEPRVEKCISSYHCKTALLHCTETTEPGFWQEDNLLKCITRCLEILRRWITELFCPQLIFNEENLFAGKVDESNRCLLESIFTEIINSDGRALLQVEMDGLGHKLQGKLSTEPSSVAVIDSLVSVVLIGHFEYLKQKVVRSRILMSIRQTEIDTNPSLIIHSAFENIYKLNAMMVGSDKLERKVIRIFVRFLSSWVGSLLAALLLSHNKNASIQAIQLMGTAAQHDVASMLKLASVFYCSRKFRKAEALLQQAKESLCTNGMQIVCSCYDNPGKLPPEICQTIYALKEQKARDMLFAHCVTFSTNEVHCAPKAMHYELYRSIGNDVQHRDPDQDAWMALCVVDCQPFLYYLQYLTYKQLGQQELTRRSLHNLNQCIREKSGLCHRETCWNLLGQCLELEQDRVGAILCYHESLRFRQKNNAANWHLAILWYKEVNNSEISTRVVKEQTEKY